MNSVIQNSDVRLESTRARFSDVLKRHSELAERLSRDSDKTIFERLHREFQIARASQTQETYLDGEQWNDGLLATIRERVHMEVERKASLPGDFSMYSAAPHHEKVTYKAGNKVICCLEGARIGIQYETTFAGEPCELYHCVLESKSFLEKMVVLEHTVPFFLPLHEVENELLSTNAMKFIDHVGDLLQAYVDRREQSRPALRHSDGKGIVFRVVEDAVSDQRTTHKDLEHMNTMDISHNIVRLIKELYGNQIKELYHSLPYQMVEFVLDDFDCKVIVSLRYGDLGSTVPSTVSVLAWPKHQLKKFPADAGTVAGKESGPLGSHCIPIRLPYAEDALRSMSLPQAYAEIVLNLPRALQDLMYQENSMALIPHSSIS